MFLHSGYAVHLAFARLGGALGSWGGAALPQTPGCNTFSKRRYQVPSEIQMYEIRVAAIRRKA